MKNMFKLNRKGFTLVELLAVIVILALLIVITANTVLPMMNKSKQNAMVVYAERVLNTASASYQADSITGGDSAKHYSIAKLMGEDNYYGCVKVETDSSSTEVKYKYSIAIFKDDDKIGIVKEGLTGVVLEGAADTLATTANHTNKKVTGATAVAEDSGCTDNSYKLSSD